MSDLAERALSVLGSARKVSSDFDLNPGTDLPADRKLRPAGVLLALAQQDRAWHIFLTKRSSALKHHPGQVAFPGGKQDPEDATITETALREAEEEIGLPRHFARVVGTLPAHETVTGFLVTPSVAVIDTAFDVRRQPSEVEEVFTVPLDHVLVPSNYVIASRRWRGRMRSYYAVPYGPYYIWGATARMLRGWADVFQERHG